jgi:hypothetical protein
MPMHRSRASYRYWGHLKMVRQIVEVVLTKRPLNQ